MWQPRCASIDIRYRRHSTLSEYDRADFDGALPGGKHIHPVMICDLAG